MRLVALDVQGREVLVVGGGKVAARKARPLLEDGAVIRVVAPALGEEVLAWLNGGNLSLEQRAVEQADLDGVWLVIAATDDPAVNSQVAAWAQQRLTPWQTVN